MVWSASATRRSDSMTSSKWPITPTLKARRVESHVEKVKMIPCKLRPWDGNMNWPIIVFLWATIIGTWIDNYWKVDQYFCEPVEVTTRTLNPHCWKSGHFRAGRHILAMTHELERKQCFGSGLWLFKRRQAHVSGIESNKPVVTCCNWVITIWEASCRMLEMEYPQFYIWVTHTHTDV